MRPGKFCNSGFSRLKICATNSKRSLATGTLRRYSQAMQQRHKAPCLRLIAVGICLLPLLSLAEDASPPLSLAELQHLLTDKITQPQYAVALWGAKVVSLDTGRTLFEYN